MSPPEQHHEESVSALLHDARPLRFSRDQESGDWSMEVTIYNLSKSLTLPVETVYTIVFKQTAKISAETLAPGPKAEWYEHNVSGYPWRDFLDRLSEVGCGDIYDAVATVDSEGVCLRLFLSLDKHRNEWYVVTVVAKSFECFRSDGWAGSFEELVEMGQTYWANF